MAKKKLLAFAAAVASFAMVIPAFSASAAETSSVPKLGDQFKVGGVNVKMYANFEEFDDGYLCGKTSTRDDWYIDPLYSCFNGPSCAKDGADYGLNMHIGAGIGVDGSKGLAYAVRNTVAATGINDGAQFQADKVADGVTDFRGATDVVFWIDCTKYANPTVQVSCVWTEKDYNDDGTPYFVENEDTKKMEQSYTSWGLYSNRSKVYYTLQDGATEWTTVEGLKGSYVEVPNTFKGYIRIPLIDFLRTWDTDNMDGKQNLAFIQRFGVFTGMNPTDADKDYVMVADNFGFAGDFQDVAPLTTNTNPATTTSGVIDTATTNGTTNGAGDSTTASSNPATGEVPITAAVVTAIVFAGVLVISKKKA